MSEKTDRVKSALAGYRRALRKLAGEGVFLGELQRAPEGADDPSIFAELDATPEEIAAHLIITNRDLNTLLSATRAAASIGMAVEMSMHEVNSETSIALSNLRAIINNESDNASTRQHAEYAYTSIEHLKTTLAAMNALTRKYRTTMTGSEIAETLEQHFGRMRRDVDIEVTEAFRKSTFHSGNHLAPAVINLVRNAAYWAGKDNRRAHIRVDVEPVDYTWKDIHGNQIESHANLVHVDDNGPGIPEGEHESIFAPFRSGRNSSGVGLSICREAMGHHDTVIASTDPSPLGGARFTIGPKSLIRPLPGPPMDRTTRLLTAAIALRDRIENVDIHTAAQEYAADWGDICQEVMILTARGAETEEERALLEAHGEILYAMEWSRLPLPTP